MMTFQFIISCLYFFLPAYFTNMTPPLIKKAAIFNFLAKPIDFGKKIWGEPILGSHKTWRGMVFGIIVGILIVCLQCRLYQFQFIKNISLVDYSQINAPLSSILPNEIRILFFGFLMSSGAVFGDISFALIKRRLKKMPGERFIPFDQTNYVIGAFIFLQPCLRLNLTIWLTIFILTFFLHIIINRLGYLTGLHQSKW